MQDISETFMYAFIKKLMVELVTKLHGGSFHLNCVLLFLVWPEIPNYLPRKNGNVSLG